MIGLINASALKSSAGPSHAMSASECAAFLQRYAGSEMRLWVYDRSHSKLVVRVSPVTSHLTPLDIVFTSTEDVRSPVLWTAGEIAVEDDDQQVKFLDRSADVAIVASDFVIVVQDEFPSSIWEFQPFSQNA